VFWLGIYWFFLGIPILFDIYVSKKVNWTPWKKRGVKNHFIIEWIDALIFAVVAVTIINIFIFQNYKIPTGSMEKTLLIGDHLYVSKVSYGPRIPTTPLAFPFAQHTMPLTKSTPSYLEWIRWPYKRLAGLSQVKNDDIVVFNFPEGDTVFVDNQTSSYYSVVRDYATQLKMQEHYTGRQLRSDKAYYLAARKMLWDRSEIVVRPADKTDNYIKRCVAIAGDTLHIIHGRAYINGKPQKNFEKMQYMYFIKTNGSSMNTLAFERMGVYRSDISSSGSDEYVVPLTFENAEKVRKFANVLGVEKAEKPVGEPSQDVFPHDSRFAWNEDNYGPLWIPKKGVTVTLTLNNLSLYDRIIEVYESNKLKVVEGVIFINDKPTNQYTFKYNYYFMMGDNRHSSLDSRYWGFVPETHIIGRPIFIWLSLDKEKQFPMNIRWSRMFKKAE